jgi:hypothetical protein
VREATSALETLIHIWVVSGRRRSRNTACRGRRIVSLKVLRRGTTLTSDSASGLQLSVVSTRGFPR